MKTKRKFRKPQLEQYKRVWLTREGHAKLRKLKTKIKRSMAQIVLDLIIKEYKKYAKD